MKSFKRILPTIIVGFLVFLIGCTALEKGRGERVRLKEPRIKLLAESEWNAEQQKLLNPLRLAHLGGRVVNLNTTLANHPKLLERWLPFGIYTFKESTLPQREREILILRIGWLSRSAYEFGQHALIGRSAGLTCCNRCVDIFAYRCISDSPEDFIHNTRIKSHSIQHFSHGNRTKIEIIEIFQRSTISAKRSP